MKTLKIGDTVISRHGPGKIEKIELCEKPWAIDTGELTPSLKLKRKVILQKYAHLVDKIYQD